MTNLPAKDATPNGQWLTLPAAAAQLGVSERTLTRRIASGHFRAERFDGRVRVWIRNSDGDMSANPANANEHMAEMTDTTTELSVTLGQAIELLKESMERERERADTESKRAGAAEARLETAIAQMLVVEQRADEARETAAMYQERSRNLEAENARLSAQLALPPSPHESQSRPWWRRWQRG